MTEEAQRIALATARGWTDCRPRASVTDRPWISGFNPSPDTIVGTICARTGMELEPGPQQPETLPNYPQDLNAMHEFEKAQLFSTRKRFRQVLQIVMSRLHPDNLIAMEECIHASAAQRAEAMLVALGLWEVTT